MEMKIIDRKTCLCHSCMEEHEVQRVLVRENITFKGKKVSCDAEYYYCDRAEEFYADERQIRENDKRLKDAYRQAEGLLTPEDIIAVRLKYGISQSDLCALLGWGAKTITRYESHQVQDMAHDAILKKIDNDPEWFISLLLEAKERIAPASFDVYMNNANVLFENDKDAYLRRAIEAEYAKYHNDPDLHGNTELSLDKVIDVIRYFSSNVRNLYKVRLMKYLWYADALSYKRRGISITGLVYQALPMGAVPVGHNSIIDLKGVPSEEVNQGDSWGYLFSLNGEKTFNNISKEEKKILDEVIQKFCYMKTENLIVFMHNEQAYVETKPKDAISFKYADALQI